MTENFAHGLYDPKFEHDSCGFGLIANIDDVPSHWLIETAISALARLTHRGAVAADGKTGDGCGLLIKFPDTFLRAVADDLGIHVGERFGVGMVFLSQDSKLADRVRSEINKAITDSELEVAGWRTVPVNAEVCGELAKRSLPRIEQVFVNAPAGMQRGTFNRQLFIARRRAEKQFAEIDPTAYVASLSSATTFAISGLSRPYVFFTSDFQPTPCLSGGSRNRFDSWHTMARSTQFRATATGRWHGRTIFVLTKCLIYPHSIL